MTNQKLYTNLLDMAQVHGTLSPQGAQAMALALAPETPAKIPTCEPVTPPAQTVAHPAKPAVAPLPVRTMPHLNYRGG